MKTSITMNGRLQLLSDGAVLSQHTVEREALEAAVNRGPGVYALQWPAIEISVLDDAPPAPEPAPVPEPSDTSIDATSVRYGGFWNGIGNDSPALQAAVLEAATFTPPKHVVLPPRVCLRDSVYVPSQVYIVGCGYVDGAVKTIITPHADVSLSTGYMLGFNTQDGVTPVAQIYQRPFMNGLFGVFAYNAAAQAPNMRLMVAFGGTQVKNVYSNAMRQLIKKPASGTGGNYTDNWRIEDIHVAAPDAANAEYQIELLGEGDALWVHNLNFPTNVTPKMPTRAIKVKRSRGGHIGVLVNGEIALEECGSFGIAHWHAELGRLLLNQASCRVQDSWFSILATSDSAYYPIELVGRSTGGGTFELGLENVEFVHGGGVLRRAADYPADIKHDPEYVVRCHNVRRSAVMVGSEFTGTGIRLHTSAGADIPQWTANAHYLSQDGSFANDRATGLHQQTVTTFNGVLSPTAVSGYPSTLAAGTYYYRAQLLLDRVAMIGRNQLWSEASGTVAANQVMLVALSHGSNTTTSIIRVYRGTATGSYDQYVDIDSINAGLLADDGETLAGIPWISRAAGPADTITVVAGDYIVTPESGPSSVQPAEAIFANADATVGVPGSVEAVAVFNTAITADRSATVHAGVTRIGSRVRVVRTAAATGAFNINVKNPGGSTLKALASAGTWCEVELCSDSVWRVVASGSL